MVKLFEDYRKMNHRALQVWQILLSAAHNRQIITYKMLAEIMGYERPGVYGRILKHLLYYCDQNKLPPLTVLIVSKAKGKPGAGFITAENVDKAREKVFNYNWFAVYPPAAETLSEAYKTGEMKEKQL